MRLWIGGSSGLTETYMNNILVQQQQQNDHNNNNNNNTWILIGKEQYTPQWIIRYNNQNHHCCCGNGKQKLHYICCDLSTIINDDDDDRNNNNSGDNSNSTATTLITTTIITKQLQDVFDRIDTILMDDCNNSSSTTGTNNTNTYNTIYNIDSIIIGLRPLLVTYRTNTQAILYNTKIVNGLQYLLQQLFLHRSYYFYKNNNNNNNNNSCNISKNSNSTTRNAISTTTTIIHISSIAAIDHLSQQVLHSVVDIPVASSSSSDNNNNNNNNSTNITPVVDSDSRNTTNNNNNNTDPPSSSLQYPYDIFKRQCEEVITLVVNEYNKNKNSKCNDTNSSSSSIQQQQHTVQYTHIRLGAIFSDPISCIQCTSLFIQLLSLGPYLSIKIDCNSSYNVCQLIHLILTQQQQHQQQQQHHQLRPVYYYTRCISQYPYPIPYGEYLLSYKHAYYGKWFSTHFVLLLLPHCIVQYGCIYMIDIVLQFIYAISKYTSINYIPPYIESIHYLLQVTMNEHTFCMKEIVQDFPHLLWMEETMEECFIRRRHRRRQRIQQQRYSNNNNNNRTIIVRNIANQSSMKDKSI